MSRRAILGWALCGLLVYVGVDWFRTNVEVVTLHVSGRSTDYFPRLFVVDEPPAVWVRAERPDRFWLAALRSHPAVTLRRAGRDLTYRARVWDHDWDPERVDRMFRAKYGVIDRVAAWIWQRDAVQVRLDPPSEFALAQRSTITLPIE